MALLLKPSKRQHKYVVGIDYGHGETSAAICRIEWDKLASEREASVLDIDLDSAARKKVISSSICRRADEILIGDEAFEHMTDNNGIRVCFKQKPESLDGDAEKLMIDYMRAVYARIRESQEDLTDTNHIVYIARPSGWVDENSKELYRQMAKKAGIPLAGLTSESRAAIFYAKTPAVDFAKDISKGAIVFDLGSSTLDFTFLSDNEKPIDFGYNLGASIIDEAILENMILMDEDVRTFLIKYPSYRDTLKFKARKFKEEAYGRNENSKTVGGFPLANVIDENEESYEDYADTYVKMRIANLAELNSMLDSSTHYMDELKNALNDFKYNKIREKPVNGVFLTGGASRMNFIRPLIAEVLNIPLTKVKIDNDNPSLTISRGIALLGATDAITTILVSELKAKLPNLNNAQMISDLSKALSENITHGAWQTVVQSCNSWVKDGKTTDEKELKMLIEKKLEYFRSHEVSFIVNRVLRDFIKNSTEKIRKDMNEIIRCYAPDREITTTGNVQINDIYLIDRSISDMSLSLSKICDSISNLLVDFLWASIAALLFGIFCAPYYIYKTFRSDESKRKDKADKILEKKDEVVRQIKYKIDLDLRSNSQFKESVSISFKEYFNNIIDTNLQKVQIPIE